MNWSRIIIVSILEVGLLYFCPTETKAQYRELELRIHGGMVVKNWLSETFPKRKPAILYQLQWNKQTDGKRLWQEHFNYPKVGLSFFSGYLGNQQELGTFGGIVPQISFNTLKTDKWSLKATLGMGFAYFNRPFDVLDNPYNILVGSHITNLSFASLYVYRSWRQQYELTVGISTFHASNGHYQVPNVGMNIPSVDIGYRYRFYDEPKLKRTGESVENRDIYVAFRASIGAHEFAETISPVGTPKYKVLTLIPFFSKRVGNFSKLHAGFTYKYYDSFYGQITAMNLFVGKEHKKSRVWSLMAGHELMMGRVSFLAQGLVDIVNPFYKKYDELSGRERDLFRFLETWFSSRLGLQYYLFDTINNKNGNLYIGIYVNANFGEADYISTGIGFELPVVK